MRSVRLCCGRGDMGDLGGFRSRMLEFVDQDSGFKAPVFSFQGSGVLVFGL